MAKEERSLTDEKMRVEIANLIEQTSKLNSEAAKIAREWFMIFAVIFAGLIVAVATLISWLI